MPNVWLPIAKQGCILAKKKSRRKAVYEKDDTFNYLKTQKWSKDNERVAQPAEWRSRKDVIEQVSHPTCAQRCRLIRGGRRHGSPFWCMSLESLIKQGVWPQKDPETSFTIECCADCGVSHWSYLKRTVSPLYPKKYTRKDRQGHCLMCPKPFWHDCGLG